jgi:hypothetical protein
MFRRNIVYALAIFALLVAAAGLARQDQQSRSGAVKSGHYGLGRPATQTDFRKHDYLVGPKGSELPTGRGTGREGRAIYMQSCSACHGLHGEGTSDYPALVGGQGTLKSDQPLPTLGSYWPYATTVWDYVNRAMPYQNPGTLKPDEVYALTAFLLALNGIVPDNLELNERTLPAVKMPNREGFLPDARPDVK